MSDFKDIDSKLESYRNPPENYNFELGYTLFQAGKFKRSYPYLKQALKENLEKKNYEDYLHCHRLLMTIFVELCELEEIQNLRDEFEKNQQKFPLAHNTDTLTVHAYYLINLEILTGVKEEKNQRQAFDYLTQSLKLVLDENSKYSKGENPVKEIESKINIMNCLYMFSIYYYYVKDYEKCIKDLDNLKILIDYYFNLKEELQLNKSRTDNFQEQKNYHNVLEVIRKNYQFVQRMKLHFRCLEAYIEFEYKNNYEKSEKILWECYDLANKTNNSYFIPYILFYMATNYAELKDLEQAEIFLNLAEKNADPDRRLFFKALETFKTRTQVGKNRVGNYDLIFNEDEHSIVEKQKGCVNFKNQFILLDILKLFITNPGSVYSKKSLAETIWRQDYSPTTHDNKIYVTIKRLRELLEVDINNPRYVCRNSRGYYFNEKAKVLLK
ncbi:MAG: winged helix-turn-helix domain-containing protein [Bdellovibrionales bacterium]